MLYFDYKLHKSLYKYHEDELKDTHLNLPDPPLSFSFSLLAPEQLGTRSLEEANASASLATLSHIYIYEESSFKVSIYMRGG